MKGQLTPFISFMTPRAVPRFLDDGQGKVGIIAPHPRDERGWKG